MSPFLGKGPDLALERPGVARLLIDLPIGLGDRGRPHQPARIEIGERRLPLPLRDPLAHPRRIDAGVDDQMGDVDVFRTQFACGRLRNGAQAELGAGKGRVACSAAQGRRGAREEDVALAPRQHQARRFAAGQEAGITGHLPDLPEHALGRVQNREIDVGADIEDADFKRGMLVGITEEGSDLLFLARVERAGVDFSAGLLDLLHQRFELGAVAAAGEHGESL